MKEFFLKRVLDYATQTGVRFHPVPRYGGWKKWGLPDLRGFTPHLRRVNVYQDQIPNRSLRWNSSHLWLIHDILHIIFYDFATHHLGQKAWADEGRFLENHLASEAFAVLILDYHVLGGQGQGLAVEFRKGDWPVFQKINPKLPHYSSWEFCKALVDHYFTGTPEIFYPVKHKRYMEWLGHEMRYSKKQRFYVQAWLDDLVGRKPRNREVILEGSAVAGPLWELLTTLTSGDERSWEPSRPSCLFDSYSKYKKKRDKYDFRFTDITALKRDEIADFLEQEVEPSASGLFLLWQFLSMCEPQKVEKQTREIIHDLSRASQKNTIEKSQWKKVRKHCLETLSQKDWEPDPLAISTFFLP